MYWDNIAVENLDKMDVRIEKINSDDIFEIDNLNDLEYLKNTLHLKQKIYCQIDNEKCKLYNDISKISIVFNKVFLLNTIFI